MEDISWRYSHLWFCVFIIFLKWGFSATYMLRDMISLGVEMFIAFWSPWGFENLVKVSSSSSAFLFIILINSTVNIFVFYFVRSRWLPFGKNYANRSGFFRKYPITSDNKFAASFPDGSMAPYNKSHSLIQVFYFNSAVVPMSLAEDSVTFTNKSK